METSTGKMLLPFIFLPLGIEAITLVGKAQQQHSVVPLLEQNLPKAGQRRKVLRNSEKSELNASF